MDSGAWQAMVHGVAESDTTEATRQARGATVAWPDILQPVIKNEESSPEDTRQLNLEFTPGWNPGKEKVC